MHRLVSKSSAVWLAPAFLLSSHLGCPNMASAQGASGWEFVPKYSKNGIVVHKRKAETHLIEINASGLIDAPMTTVLNVIEDNDNRRVWMESSMVARIQGHIPDAQGKVPDVNRPHTYIFYNGVRIPWPFQDRYFYVALTVRCDPIRFRDQYRISQEFRKERHCTPAANTPSFQSKQVSIEFKNDDSLNNPARYPIPPGTTRITSIHGHWYFYPMICDGRKQTFVEYQIYSDLAGHIPLWLVNSKAVKIPYEIIYNLTKYILKNRSRYAKTDRIEKEYPYMFKECVEKDPISLRVP